MTERPLPPSEDLHPFDALVELMRTLRGENGCPWDREQDLNSLKAYALEECHEVLDAIDAGDPTTHRDELGDLLLQIVFQAQICSEDAQFDAYDVCRAITSKMVRRHPHVFGDAEAVDAAEVHASWEQIKARERSERVDSEGFVSVLDGVPRALPSLLRALRVSEKAAGLGFDWPDLGGVLAKVVEEFGELEEALETGEADAIQHEIGDIFFAVANLSRHLGVNPEDALRQANDRFSGRFVHLERSLADGGETPRDRSLDELEALWSEAKRATAGSQGGVGP